MTIARERLRHTTPAGYEDVVSLGHGKRAFIAAPMSALSDEATYKQNREAVLALVNHLIKEYGFLDVYYAGKNVASKSQFTDSPVALEQDLSALRESDIFILVYPDKVLSSVLIEAGCAIAWGKPMLLLVRNQKDLPYLLQEAEKLDDSSQFPHIEVRVYKDEKSLKEQVDSSISLLI